MRLATLTSVALLLSAGYALAQGTPNTMSSGRPSAVMDDAQCQTVWTMASPNGAALSQDQAVPYIVNFHMVDVDGDGGRPRHRLHASSTQWPATIKTSKT